MPSAFIDDGYTITRTLSGENYDPFDITYRPLVRSEHIKRFQEMRKWLGNGDKLKQEHLHDFDVLCANVIAGNNGWAQKLSSWTIEDSQGSPVGITTDNLLKLHPDAFADLLDVFFPTSEEEDAAKN